MKFSGKMWLTVILKVTKQQGFTLSLENKCLEKPQGRGAGVKLSPSLIKLRENLFCSVSNLQITKIY